MDYHPVFGPAPDVGLEIEIGAWQSGCDQYTLASALGDAGQMASTFFADGRHDWHCRCATCNATLSETSYPITLVSQRDASLPSDGVELITSPFPTHEVFVESLMNAYAIIGEHADWKGGERYDQRERNVSFSGLHVHAYAPGNLTDVNAEEHARMVQNAPQVLTGFIPELFTIASANNQSIRRPLTYRLPVGMNGGHHQFVAIAGREGIRSEPTQNPLRLEWRLWEMPYQDPLYVKGVTYLSASLTQALTRPRLSRIMAAQGMIHDWDRTRNDLDHILSQFSHDRMKILLELVLSGSSMKDDPVGAEAIMSLTDRI